MRSERHEQGFSHILGLVLLLAVVVVIGLIGWKIHNDRTVTPAPATTGNTSGDTSAATIIANAKSQLASKFTLNNTMGQPSAAGTLNYQESTTGPFWQVTGANYYVNVSSGHELDATFYINNSPTGASSPDLTTIDSIFTHTVQQAGLHETAVSLPSGPGTYYTDSDVVCNISDISQGADPISLSCGQLADYVAQSNKVKPFADAYFSQTGNAGPIMFDAPKVQNSKTPGYQIAYVNTFAGGGSGFEGMFYSKDGTWHYVGATQQEPACATLTANPDVRAAFLGQACVSNDSQDSTVR